MTNVTRQVVPNNFTPENVSKADKTRTAVIPNDEHFERDGNKKRWDDNRQQHCEQLCTAKKTKSTRKTLRQT